MFTGCLPFTLLQLCRWQAGRLDTRQFLAAAGLSVGFLGNPWLDAGTIPAGVDQPDRNMQILIKLSAIA